MATITAVKTGKTYRGTSKADVITITSDAGSNITVKALGGSDTIIVRGGKNSTIDAGKGDDTVTVKAGSLK